MAEIGKAVLVMVNVEDPAEKGAMFEGPFEERETDEPHAHPMARAWALWESVKDDWPDWSASVLGNKRAHNMQAAYRISAVLGTDYRAHLAELEEIEATA